MQAPAADTTRHQLVRSRTETWLLAALVLVPLVAFDPWGWAAYGPVKFAAVSTLVPATAAAVVMRHGLAVHRGWAIGWLAFLAWAGITAFTGLDPLSAWIGTPDRRLGWWAWLLFGLAFAIGSRLPDPATPILRSASAASIVIGVVAALESAGVSLLDSSTGRLGSTFGSPAYLGAAVALLLPLAVGQAARVAESTRWRVLGALAMLANLVSLLGSQSRAAIVGVAVGTAFVATRLPRRWVVTTVVVAAVGLAVTPAGTRLLDASASSRVDEWRQAVRVVADHPVLGTGPEGYRIAFPSVVDADYERAHGRAVLPDRAHSAVLDVAVTLGIPGAAMYCAAVAALLRKAWRWRRDDPWRMAVAAAVVAYLAQQQFLFPLVEVDPLLWLLSGTMFAVSGPPRDQRPPVIALAALAVLSAVAGTADVAADRALVAAARGDVTAGDVAGRLRPDSFRSWLMAADAQARSDTPEGMEAALDRMAIARRLSPGDSRLAQIEARYLGTRAALSGDPTHVVAALAAWESVAESDPLNGDVQVGLARARVLSGDLTGARTALTTAVALSPGDAGPLVELGGLALADRDIPAAADAARRALSINPAAPGLAELVEALAARGVTP